MRTTSKIAFGAFACGIGLLVVCCPGSARAQTLTSPAGIQVNGTVHASVRDGQGRTIIGGIFSSAGSQSTPRTNLARFNADGTLDQAWNPAPVGLIVWSLALAAGGNVIVGGEFSSIGGAARNNIAKVSSSGAGAADTSWNPGANSAVYALTADASGNLYAGGSFTTLGGQPRNYIARLSMATGAVDSSWNPNANALVYALALGNTGHVYAGGRFTTIGGQARARLAKLATTGTGAPDAQWNPGVGTPTTPDEVSALALDTSSNIFVGGRFGTAGSLARNNIAKIATSGAGVVDASWNPGSNGYVREMAFDGSGNLYVGGDFTSIGNVTRRYLAKLSSSGAGTVNAAWDPNPNNALFSLMLDPSGNVCVGGGFSAILGQARGNYACVTPTASVSPPTCTFTATPGSFVAGTVSIVTLVASCTPGSTNYAFNSTGSPSLLGGGTVAGDGSSATVTASFASTSPGTYTYSVTASNSGGTSTPAIATVTVLPASPPACTITATPSTFASGTATTVSLAATCTNSPTSYSWSPTAGAPAVTGTGANVTAAFPASTVAGTYSYSLSATNPAGTAGAVVQVTVTGIAAAAPACVLNAPSYYIVNQPAVTLSATCTPAATSYVWTGGACANTTGPTCVVSPAATTSYSVAGRNAGGTGRADRKTVVVATQPFPVTVTSNITPTSSTATALVQPRPQDAGAATSIYVFAHVPLNRVSSIAPDGTDGPKRFEKADATSECVLAQLLSNGQLIGVTTASMQAYVTGVLSSQGQSVNILNNVPTPNIAGATFFVGYGSTATLMFSNGTFQGVVTIPGTAQCNTTLLGSSPARTPDSLTGLWWNSGESGWGIHMTQRRGVVFAAMYTYDAAGNPKWYVASNCAMNTVSMPSGNCIGTLYEVAGPAFFNTPFNPAAVSVTPVGSLQVNFQNAGNAAMSYSVNANGRTVSLTRQLFASGPLPPAIDYTDLWWNPDESGWGLALTQQYGVMFLAWYVYDASGRPIWYVASNCVVSGSSCAGDLYRTTGPPLGPAFDASRVQVFQAGTVSLSFTDANNATLVYTVNGVREVKFIRRQEF